MHDGSYLPIVNSMQRHVLRIMRGCLVILYLHPAVWYAVHGRIIYSAADPFIFQHLHVMRSIHPALVLATGVLLQQLMQALL